MTIFSLLLSFWPLKSGFSPQKVNLNWFISRRKTIKTQMQPTKTCFSRLMTSIWRLNDVLSTILTNFSLLRTFWLLYCGFCPPRVYLNWFISRRRTLKTQLQPAKTYFSRLICQIDVKMTVYQQFWQILAYYWHFDHFNVVLAHQKYT